MKDAMGEESKSVCEKSMEVMLNIIKLSTLSVVGNKQEGAAGIKSLKQCSETSKISKRSEIAALSNPYTMETMDDAHFSDYIKSFHNKNKLE